MSRTNAPRLTGHLTLRLCAAALAAIALPASAADIRFGFYGDNTSEYYSGVKQGMDENNTQGEFLGLTFAVQQLGSMELAPGGTTAIIVSGDADSVRRVARNHPDTPVLNIGATDTELRAECIPNVFHIVPSKRMVEDALRQWRIKKPDVPVTAEVWTTRTGKYAAGQLNSRYERGQGKPMTNEAWAGWAAAKVAGDLVARTGESNPDAFIDLLRTETSFDGQRGAMMTFRNTGQLRQPLWLIAEDGSVAGEAPVRGVVDADDLDTLGITECAK